MKCAVIWRGMKVGKAFSIVHGLSNTLDPKTDFANEDIDQCHKLCLTWLFTRIEKLHSLQLMHQHRLGLLRIFSYSSLVLRMVNDL